MILWYKLLSVNAMLYRPMTAGSACADLALPVTVLLKPGEWLTLPLDVAFDIPEGYCLHMYPRSSLFTSRNLLMPVSVIDSDYKGPVHAQLYNFGKTPVELMAGQRIAQVQMLPVLNVDWTETNCIEPSGRGGLGSTGV